MRINRTTGGKSLEGANDALGDVSTRYVTVTNEQYLVAHLLTVTVSLVFYSCPTRVFQPNFEPFLISSSATESDSKWHYRIYACEWLICTAAMQSDACRLCLHTPTQLNLLEEQSLLEAVHCNNSAIPDLLKTNDPPCSTRRTEIESALDEQNARLVEIEATMTRLQKTLANLFTERRQVQQRIVDYKMILHPIRRIPRDVLDEIFIWLVNEDAVVNENGEDEECSYDLREPIWSLPHVSRQWRDSALSFPRLWSTVRVDLSSPKSSKKLPHAAFILGVQLQRSNHYPLSVAIYSDDNEFSSTDPILQALLPTSDRWENLYLDVPVESFDAFRLLPTSFPLLSCLQLWVDEFDETAVSSPSTMFQFCPNLRELHGSPKSFSMMKLPFSQIRELDSRLSDADSSACFDALTRLTNLCTFSLSPNDDNDEMGIDHPETTLSCLSTLYLNRDKPGPIHLFRYLRSPSLINLYITGLDRVCDLVPFLKRCKSLDSLFIESASLTDTDCIQVLEATPSLTEVVFECPLIYTAEFVNSLIGDGDSTPRLVPSLELLRVSDSAGFDHSQVTRLMEGRPELELITFDE